MRRSKTVIGLLIATFGLSAAPARADGFELCNRAQVEMWSAIGFLLDGQWQSQGWWHLKPGACARALSGDLQTGNRYYYVFAENKQRGKEWTGPHSFCVHESSAFNAIGSQSCAGRGYSTRGFIQVDITDANGFIWSFTDSNSFAPPR
jgi:uncharacterized membrane protein